MTAATTTATVDATKAYERQLLLHKAIVSGNLDATRGNFTKDSTATFNWFGKTVTASGADDISGTLKEFWDNQEFSRVPQGAVSSQFDSTTLTATRTYANVLKVGGSDITLNFKTVCTFAPFKNGARIATIDRSVVATGAHDKVMDSMCRDLATAIGKQAKDDCLKLMWNDAELNLKTEDCAENEVYGGEGVSDAVRYLTEFNFAGHTVESFSKPTIAPNPEDGLSRTFKMQIYTHQMVDKPVEKKAEVATGGASAEVPKASNDQASEEVAEPIGAKPEQEKVLKTITLEGTINFALLEDHEEGNELRINELNLTHTITDRKAGWFGW